MIDSKMTPWANEAPEVQAILERIGRERSAEVEGFFRRARSRRVEYERSSEGFRMRGGVEEGGAVRWWAPARSASGFVASSGAPASSAERCRLLAGETPESPQPQAPWCADAVAGEDGATGAELPETAEMTAWLAAQRLEDAQTAWIEAAVTEEVWATGGGVAQIRRRERVWACRSGAAAPEFLAERGWSAFTRRSFAPERAAAGDRQVPEGVSPVLSAAAAARLVLLLARRFHAPGMRPGLPVGPGWVLRADEPDGLFGARFDDVGFAAAPRELSDGERTRDVWGGPGSWRRASFRDRPEPLPNTLRLDPPKAAPPPPHVWVEHVDVRPAGEGWSMRFHPQNDPEGLRWSPWTWRVAPESLLRACLGGVGPVRTSHHGVATPALVFDGCRLTRGG